MAAGKMKTSFYAVSGASVCGSSRRIQGVGFPIKHRTGLDTLELTAREWEEVQALIGTQISQTLIYLLLRRGFSLLLKEDHRNGSSHILLMDIKHPAGVA